MRWAPTLCAALALSGASWSQQAGLLNSKEVLTTAARAVDLMESTAAAVPGLVRAAAPVEENARQALANLRTLSPQHGALTYTLLTNLRAYLSLADALPKPQPFPEEARKQFGELRDQIDRLEAHFRALLDQKEVALRNPDRDNLRRYAEANQKLPAPQAGRPRVVFLGDSITDGWRLNEYFAERDFVNRGIGGQITGEMLGRMKADVIDLKPAAVLVLAGTNDIARGVPPRAIQNNLTMIADLAQAHGIKPLFASVLPVSDYHQDKNPAWEQSKRRPPETIRALNAWLQGFCRQRNYTYVDYFPALVDKAGFLQAEAADDGLHPNAAGYRLMAPIALAAIEQALGPPPKGKGRR
ncbi:MAG: GDSL-type esterase/lipase family protein [Acidobacteriota bacterium]